MNRFGLLLLTLCFSTGFAIAQTGLSEEAMKTASTRKAKTMADYNKSVTSEKRNVTEFHTLTVNVPFEVIIDQGAAPSVKVESSAGLIPYILTTVNLGILEISAPQKTFLPTVLRVYITTTGRLNVIKARQKALIRFASPYATPKLLVELMSGATFQAGEEIVANEVLFNLGRSSRMISSMPVRAQTVKIYNYASSEVDARFEAEIVDIENGSSAKTVLSGSAALLRATVSGASRLNSSALQARHVEIATWSLGKAIVFASESFAGRKQLFSSIQCLGNPPRLQIE